MNFIPSDKLSTISENVLMSDVGIVSVLKTKDVVKKQYHSYQISPETFNKTNKLVSSDYSKEWFKSRIGYLSDGQPFEFTTENRIQVPISEPPTIVFEKVDPNDSFYKIKTSNVLEKFEKVNCYIDSEFEAGGKTIDIRKHNEFIYIPKRLDKYCLLNNHTVAVYINGIKVPDNLIYVFSNKSLTDFFIDEDWINGHLLFEDGLLKEGFNFSVDVFNWRDTKSNGTTNFYRHAISKSTMLSKTITFSNVENNKVPILTEHDNFNKISLYVNGQLVNVTDVNITEVSDSQSSVSITTDSDLTTIEPYNNEYIFEYNYLDSVKYLHHHKGLVYDSDIDLDTSISVNTIKYSVYFKRILENEYEVNLFINDNGSTAMYKDDIIVGAVPLGALSIFISGKKVPITEFTQSSRFSYTAKMNLKDDLFVEGNTSEFYFIIEDADQAIIDTENEFYNMELVQYGQDYYLANFLGTARAHQYAYNNDEMLLDPYKYGGFINKALELEQTVIPEDERRVNKADGTVNYNYFKNILGSRDNISTLDSEIDLLNYNKNLDLIIRMMGKSAEGFVVDEMTELNPSLVRELLTLAGNETVYKYIPSNEVPDNVVITLMIGKYNNPSFNVYVNRKLVLEDINYSVNRKPGDVATITIPKDQFIVNPQLLYYLNTVEVQIIETYNDKLKVLRLFDNDSNPMHNSIRYDATGKISISLDYISEFFGEDTVNDLSQLVVLKRIDKSYTKIVYGSGNYGWSALRNKDGELITFSIENNNLVISGLLDIISGASDIVNFYLYDKKFRHYTTRVITKDDTYNAFTTVTIPLEYINPDNATCKYNGDYVDLSGIPIVSSVNPEISVNGVVWYNGLDFEYVTPLENDIIATSMIVLRSPIKDDSMFTIDFLETEKTDIVLNQSCINNNKYGLLYFEDLEYPFSLDYLDLYVNGLKVQPCDISILSDKLIRIGNVFGDTDDKPVVWTQGFQSVRLTTKFKESNDFVTKLCKNYVLSDLEYLIRLLFFNSNPALFEPDMDYPLENEIEEGYETFVERVDDFGRQPFGKQTPIISGADVLVTAYLEWLVKSKTTRAHSINNPNDNDSCVIREYVRQYFSIYHDLLDTNYDVVANSGSNNLLGSDISAKIIKHKDSTEIIGLYPPTYKSTSLRVVLDHFKDFRDRLSKDNKTVYEYGEDNLDENQKHKDNRFVSTLLHDYVVDKSSNIMYKEDYPLNFDLANDNNIMIIGGGEDDINGDFLAIGTNMPKIDVEEETIENKVYY